MAVAGHEGLEGGDAVVCLQHRAQLRLQAGDGGRHHGHRHRQTAEPAPPVAARTHNYELYVFSTGVIDNASIDKDCYKQMVIIYSFFNEFLPFPEKHQGYVTPLMALTREGEGIEEAEFSWIWSQQHTEDMNETES